MSWIASDVSARIKAIVEKIDNMGHKHLSEKEMFDYYEGESRRVEQVFTHMGKCKNCHDKYILFAEEQFKRDLNAVKKLGIIVLFL